MANPSLTQTTLAAAVGTTDNLLPVADVAGIVVGAQLYLDRELVLVTAIGINATLGVTRGVAGIQSAHDSGVTVTVGNPDQFYLSDPVGPVNGDLSLPWINVAMGNIWTVTDGAWVLSDIFGSPISGGGGGTPGGSDTQVQFNDAGSFGGIDNGTAGQVLTSNGASSPPSFQNAGGGGGGFQPTVLLLNGDTPFDAGTMPSGSLFVNDGANGGDVVVPLLTSGDAGYNFYFLQTDGSYQVGIFGDTGVMLTAASGTFSGAFTSGPGDVAWAIWTGATWWVVPVVGTLSLQA